MLDIQATGYINRFSTATFAGKNMEGWAVKKVLAGCGEVKKGLPKQGQ